MNPSKEVHCIPGEEESGGKLLEMWDLNFVTRVVALHNKSNSSANKCDTNEKQAKRKKRVRRSTNKADDNANTDSDALKSQDTREESKKKTKRCKREESEKKSNTKQRP